ncbi:MAG: hypothetical protein R3F59_09425 [Myxococcota bacterium]
MSGLEAPCTSSRSSRCPPTRASPSTRPVRRHRPGADATQATHLDPALAVGFDVVYCEYHFPAGSTQLANLTAAVDAYNAAGADGVWLDLVPDGNTTAHAILDNPFHPSGVPPFYAVTAGTAFVDFYDGSTMDGAAGMMPGDCDPLAPTPRPCATFQLEISDVSFAAAAADPTVVGDAVSVRSSSTRYRSHAGFRHPAPRQRDPANGVVWDLPTVHGNKHDDDDSRTAVMTAAAVEVRDHGLSAGVHRPGHRRGRRRSNMVLADEVTGEVVEFSPARDYESGDVGLLPADLNRTSLRWDSASSTYLTCETGTDPHWMGHISETSTNTVNKQFTGRFAVRQVGTNTWSALAGHLFGSHLVGTTFRQIDWDPTFTLSGAAAGLSNPAAMTTTTLRFRLDPDDVLTERDESNNAWAVTLCLYPEADIGCDDVPCVQ